MPVEPQQRDAHPIEDHCGSMNLPTSVAERINMVPLNVRLGDDEHASNIKLVLIEAIDMNK